MSKTLKCSKCGTLKGVKVCQGCGVTQCDACNHGRDLCSACGHPRK
ncbi:MAG: hypothetical protein ACYS47_07415 [Planctomycetota bacterium]